MKTLCEVRWVLEGTEDDEEPKYERGTYILLHWGLKYEIVTDKEGNTTAVNYTIAICQHCETGAVETFMPEQLKILGERIKI